MKNIKISKTFTGLVVLIVAAFTLIPNLISGYAIYKDRNDQNKYLEVIEHRSDRLRQSLLSLNIPDKDLQSCIETGVNLYAGIHPENGGIDNAAQLEQLNCFKLKIKSLEGIHQFSELKSLDLSYNPVADLQPLLALKKLEHLSLSGKEVDDLDFLLRLKSLKQLSMPNTENIFCTKVASFMENAHFESLGGSHAKSNCLGNEGMVLAQKDIDQRRSKKTDLPFPDEKVLTDQANEWARELVRDNIERNKSVGKVIQKVTGISMIEFLFYLPIVLPILILVYSLFSLAIKPTTNMKAFAFSSLVTLVCSLALYWFAFGVLFANAGWGIALIAPGISLFICFIVFSVFWNCNKFYNFTFIKSRERRE